MTIEHKDLPNSELHEPKGVDTAISGTTYTSNGVGSGTWEVPKIQGQNTALVDQVPFSDGAGGVNWRSVPLIEPALVARDLTDQVPVGLSTPLQLTFGQAAADNGFFSVAGDGSITCTKVGRYNFNFYFQFSRTNGPGDSLSLIRPLINGLPIDNRPMAIEVGSNAVTYPMQFEAISITLAVNDVITFEMIRDSSGADEGYLKSATNTEGWVQSPSTSVIAYFLSEV
jgi:hypothetical protein